MSSRSTVPTEAFLSDFEKNAIRTRLQDFSRVLLKQVLACFTLPGRATAQLCKWQLAAFTNLEDILELPFSRERDRVLLVLVLNSGSEARETTDRSLMIENVLGQAKHMERLNFKALCITTRIAVTETAKECGTGCIVAPPVEYGGKCMGYHLDLGLLSVDFTPVLVLQGGYEYCTFDQSGTVSKLALDKTYLPVELETAASHGLAGISLPIIENGMPLQEVLAKIAVPVETKRIIQERFQSFLEMFKERVLAHLLEKAPSSCAWVWPSHFTDLKEVIESLLIGESIAVNLGLVLNRNSKILEVDGGPLVIKNAAGNLAQMTPLDFQAIYRAINAAVTSLTRDKGSDCFEVRPIQYNGHDCQSYYLGLGVLSVLFTPVLALEGDREYYTFDRSKVVNKIIPGQVSPAEIAAREHPVLRDFFPALALLMHRAELLHLFPRTTLYYFYVDCMSCAIKDTRFLTLGMGEYGYNAHDIRELLRGFFSCLQRVDDYRHCTLKDDRSMFSAFDENIKLLDLFPCDSATEAKLESFAQRMMGEKAGIDDRIVEDIVVAWRGFARLD